jgi:hypothetical protein
MNNNANLRTNVFIIAIAVLFTITMTTTAVSMVPAVYAEPDGGDDDENSGGNENKAEDDSAAAIADCDDNDVEEANFECVAATGLRFTGQDILINGMSMTLLSDETDPATQDSVPIALPLPT